MGFQYTDDKTLNNPIYDLVLKTSYEADLRHGFIQCHILSPTLIK
ncbi:hypothetical protein [Photorhabdus thracensis]|nr:hypothetical protein [Photorhabdus thracensis]